MTESNNKQMPLDPPICESELQRLLDLYYKDCERIQEECNKPKKIRKEGEAMETQQGGTVQAILHQLRQPDLDDADKLTLYEELSGAVDRECVKIAVDSDNEAALLAKALDLHSAVKEFADKLLWVRLLDQIHSLRDEEKKRR